MRIFIVFGFLFLQSTLYADFSQHHQLFGRSSCSLEWDLRTGLVSVGNYHSSLIIEGAAQAVDPETGQLLFYSDGDRVYNRTHRLMPNGTGLRGFPSSTNAAIIVPVPGKDLQYYIFSNAHGYQSETNEFWLHTVDLSLENGFGDVVQSQRLYDDIGEGMVVIPSTADPKEYWLIANTLYQSQAHLVFSIKTSGVDLHATIPTNYKSSFNLNYFSEIGSLVGIDNATHSLRLRPFDAETGTLLPISSTIATQQEAIIYDVEISATGNLLYFSIWKHPHLYQVTLRNSATVRLIYSSSDETTTGGGLLRGPDNRIYFISGEKTGPQEEVHTLSVVNSPDEVGQACDFRRNALTLNTRMNKDIQFSASAWSRPGVAGRPSGIINQYAEVLDVCNTQFLVRNPEGFNVGDTVLIMQMGGSSVVIAENAEAGIVSNYGTAGLSEYNVIKSITGNSIELERVTEHTYDPFGQVQLITVPYLGADVITGGLTCGPWNGATGGVLAFSGGRITMANDIDVSGYGYRGGRLLHQLISCGEEQGYYLPVGTLLAGMRGESFLSVAASIMHGVGRLLSGGCAGSNHNGSGAGGANAGAGGNGGLWQGCLSALIAQGGQAIETAGKRFFMGGGGGAGHENNFLGTAGGHGGGMVIIRAKEIVPNGHRIRANGQSIGYGDHYHDGAGGGGAGGSVVLEISGIQTERLTIEVRGGYGGGVIEDHGGGGGGGGGLVVVNELPPGGLNVDARGGAAGLQQGQPSLARLGEDGRVELFEILFPTEEFVELNLQAVELTTGCDSTSRLLVTASGTGLTFELEGMVAPTGEFTDLTSGDYLLEVTNGCETEDRVITVKNYSPVQTDVLGVLPLICRRGGEVEMTGVEGKSPYTYSLNGGTVVTRGEFTGLPAGEHLIEVTDDLGCSVNRLVTIPDSSYALIVTLPEDTTVQQGATFQLYPRVDSPYSDFVYEWFPWVIVDDPALRVPAFSLGERFNTEAMLRVTDAVGCQGEASTIILVERVDIFVPTGFSPNDDGRNDRFGVYANPTIRGTIDHLRITNRWGVEVYGVFNVALADATDLWDGLVSGEPAATGDYVLEFKLTLNDGSSRKYKNGLTLMR